MMNIVFGIFETLTIICFVAFFASIFMKNWLQSKGLSRKKALIGTAILFFVFAAIGGAINPDKTVVQSESAQKPSPTATIAPTDSPTSIPQVQKNNVLKKTPTHTPTPTKKPKPTSTPEPTIADDANGFPENYQTVTVANLSKEPSAYNNKTVEFNCSVATFAKDSNGNATAVNCIDPNDYSSIVQVDASDWDLTKINQDDSINVYGLGQGAFTGKNAYGGDVSEPLVLGMYVNDLTSGYSNSK